MYLGTLTRRSLRALSLALSAAVAGLLVVSLFSPVSYGGDGSSKAVLAWVQRLWTDRWSDGSLPDAPPAGIHEDEIVHDRLRGRLSGRFRVRLPDAPGLRCELRLRTRDDRTWREREAVHPARWTRGADGLARFEFDGFRVPVGSDWCGLAVDVRFTGRDGATVVDDRYERRHGRIAAGFPAEEVDRLTRDGEAAVPDLVAAAASSDPFERQGAAHALRRLAARPYEAVPALEGLLDDPYAAVRLGALEALEAYGADAAPALAAVRARMIDPGEHYLVRGMAVRALGAMGPRASAAVSDLAAGFEGRRAPEFLGWRVEALGRVGRAARPWAPAIRRWREREGAEVSRLCDEALSRLAGA
jgi:hypothetical protein